MAIQKDERKFKDDEAIPPVHTLDDAQNVDRILQATFGRITGGLSPASLGLAFFDWYFHLCLQPAKQMELVELGAANTLKIYQYLICVMIGGDQKDICDKNIHHDKRFKDPSWQAYPFDILHQSFSMMQNWWTQAALDVRGVSRHHQEVVHFTLRQILDMISPSNFVWTNPEVIKITMEENGQNFSRGMENYIDDLSRYIMDSPPAGSENYIIGKNIAVSRGNVIFRNSLIELIQYAPETSEVYREPILITPAWIMKYYILDLAPKHSLVKYLVQNGHTVFMISWKNPTKDDCHLGMEDYLKQGIFASLKAIEKIVPGEKVHLIGYCLGGTLSAIAGATLARDHADRLKTLTLLAAQTDFTEPGELGLFIDESQITFLESMMSEKGYLDTHQMAGAFQLLRPNDLIWSRLIRDYFLGQRKPLTDLMSWNADATRLPFTMHSEYLRRLFLNNDLATGKYMVGGKPITLSEINVPLFVVATERDHVSPWESVFKINRLTTTDVTFVLTSGGHNVGIVSLPSKHTKRYYRMSTLTNSGHYIGASSWFQQTKVKHGSWWPALEKWLSKESSGKMAPPPMGNKQANLPPLENAPGTYVRQK